MILVTYKNRPGINMTAYCLSGSYLSLNDSTFLLSKHNSKQWLFQCISLLFAGLHIQLILHQVGPQYSFEVYRILHRSSTISHGYHQSPQIRCSTSCSLTKAPRPPDAIEPISQLSMPTTSPYLENACTEKGCPLGNHRSHTQRWSIANILHSHLQ